PLRPNQQDEQQQGDEDREQRSEDRPGLALNDLVDDKLAAPNEIAHEQHAPITQSRKPSHASSSLSRRGTWCGCATWAPCRALGRTSLDPWRRANPNYVAYPPRLTPEPYRPVTRSAARLIGPKRRLFCSDYR